MHAHLKASAAAACLVCSLYAAAQITDSVVINASGAEQRSFELPFAVSVVGADDLRAAGAMLNLSEALGRVPGLVVANRSNAAQDLQINSRGFGARAPFGVRGLRLYSDGIPASGPDGQGQVSSFDLAGAARIEVLRGPFSALQGNSSGGVISLVSTAVTERRLSFDTDAGSDGLRQSRFTLAAPLEGGFNVRAQVSRWTTDGPRPQSNAQRSLGNLRLGWDKPQDRVVLVLNSINQPALDPLGLTRAQLDTDPRQTTTQALPQISPGQADRFNTRKNTWQDQAGVSWRHRFNSGEQSSEQISDQSALRESQVVAFSGKRSVTQWQAIPVATQVNPTNPSLSERQAGGVIDFDRRYAGVDARLVWRWAWAEGRSVQWVAGAAVETSTEDRRGFENFTGPPATRALGVTGKLRRDEVNRLRSTDIYSQAEIDIATAWAATLGVRSGRLAFRSDDRYVVGRNADDSGSLNFSYTNPVAALQWRASPTLNAYLSLGRGFESPTLNELAYRADGAAGFNSALQAQTSRQAELGAKWRPAGGGASADVALFEARSANEIGVASNSGGRASFQNVGRTTRRGLEVAGQAQLMAGWRAQIAATVLQATYSDNFAVCASVPCTTPTVPVPAGNRIAGTQAKSLFAELAWRAAPGLEFALEARGQGRVPVNDLNSDFAAGFGLLGLRARWWLDVPVGRLEVLGRVDNLANRLVAGSVIVAEANGRFFEPAPARSVLLSLRWTAPF